MSVFTYNDYNCVLLCLCSRVILARYFGSLSCLLGSVCGPFRSYSLFLGSSVCSLMFVGSLVIACEYLWALLCLLAIVCGFSQVRFVMFVGFLIFVG